MATITAGDNIDKAEIILMDTSNTRWGESELLGWHNDGQREIVVYKPDACVTNDAVQLSAGIKQSLPSGGIILIDIPRNMGTDGSTPGRSVTLVDKAILDAVNPDWPSATASATVKHYMHDPRDPLNFYVYPPQPDSNQGYVEEVYTDTPDDCATTGDTISVADIYANALINYILFRAYAKDADYDANDERVRSAWGAFLNSLGVQEQKEAQINPNLVESTEPSPSITKGG